MMEYVLDSSVAAKWFVIEPGSVKALALLTGGHELHAPDFFILEMESILCKWHRRGVIDRKEADRARVSVPQVGIHFHPSSQLRDHAYSLALLTGQSFYDCLYLALAHLVKKELITDDQRFYKGLAGTTLQKRVRLLGSL